MITEITDDQLKEWDKLKRQYFKKLKKVKKSKKK